MTRYIYDICHEKILTRTLFLLLFDILIRLLVDISILNAPNILITLTNKCTYLVFNNVNVINVFGSSSNI